MHTLGLLGGAHDVLEEAVGRDGAASGPLGRGFTGHPLHTHAPGSSVLFARSTLAWGLALPPSVALPPSLARARWPLQRHVAVAG